MDEPYDFSYAAEIEGVASKPTTVTWIKHLAFLAITFCTATIAGVVPPFGPGINFPPLDLPAWNDTALFTTWAPTLYALFVVDVIQSILSNPSLLLYGMSFSIPLLIILISHEMGHYVACRLYGVEATLPYFIPTPPMVGPAGTFGAFIRIKSRIPTRRAIFDIGVAGPIAGFIALIPIAIIGISLMQIMPETTIPSDTLVFADPLMMKLIGVAFGKNVTFGVGNPFYYAAWMGLLVTALNLIPSGQLDGGHAMYAALGEKVHAWTGRIAFIVMAVLSVLGMLFYGSPSGFLIAILLGVMMRIPHPQPWDNTPLDAKRKVIALLTLLIFILCFVPFPLQIT
ncbi:MAG TPA: site-2 protease family protein [Pyrinomonadaceae bacterium]|nr:site-2 protease family protein [Pyrinomonadaceae bacterium]